MSSVDKSRRTLLGGAAAGAALAVTGRFRLVELAMAERETFYGTREIGVRDAAGHWLTFAERVAGHDVEPS